MEAKERSKGGLETGACIGHVASDPIIVLDSAIFLQLVRGSTSALVSGERRSCRSGVTLGQVFGEPILCVQHGTSPNLSIRFGKRSKAL